MNHDSIWWFAHTYAIPTVQLLIQQRAIKFIIQERKLATSFDDDATKHSKTDNHQEMSCVTENVV